MAKKKVQNPNSFEEGLARLETVVAQLEGGDLGLAEALAQYEEGVKHLKACYQQLQHAERRIELLSGVDASGNPVTEPFDEKPSEDLADKAASRSRKRSASGQGDHAPSGRVDDGERLF